MKSYTPRRASKSRWLQDAPEYVLDCFDDKRFPIDRYTVLFTGSLLGRIKDSDEVYILGWSPCGSFDLKPHEAANFRYANGKRRVRWTDLPEDVREEVKTWAERE